MCPLLLPVILLALPTSVVERLQAASVTIETADGYGSGTQIKLSKRTVILTAKHILCRVTEDADGDPVAGAMLPGPFEASRPHKDAPGGLQDGRDCSTVILVCTNKLHDLAIVGPLRDSFKADTVPISPTDAAIGDQVWVVSSRHGPTYANSVSKGIVSALGRVTGLDNGHPEGVDQTDAAVSNGSSGGGVFNEQGELVGVINRKFDENMGFYTPARAFRKWLKELEE